MVRKKIIRLASAVILIALVVFTSISNRIYQDSLPRVRTRMVEQEIGSLLDGYGLWETLAWVPKECIFPASNENMAIGRYAHLSERDGYSITFECSEDVLVLADEILILQVIYNLISNAINYTGEDKKVIIAQSVSDGICRITVSDTGEGIPKEKLPHIWDRYYRTGDFHKRAVSGTGLGLSIVKNALILHHAPFGVSSTVGEGSDFWFELPVLDETQGII